MFNPKVSIIIPVYNWSNYLSEAIESALDQTYKNIEILVINDGSNDNWATEKIALSFENKINYFYKDNWWVATALNLWIEKMSWEYFSWLSHDDLYCPNKIEEQIKFLQDKLNKNIIITTDIKIINWDWETTIDKVDLSYKSDRILYTLIIKWVINWCTLLVPKIAFDTEWNFNKDLKTTQDYDMWFRIIKNYNFFHLNKSLVKSRIHEKQDTIRLKHLCAKEQNNLRKQIHKYFSIYEIRKSSWSNLPILFFRIKLFFLQNRTRILSILVKITSKLWLYNSISHLWRKYILKI